MSRINVDKLTKDIITGNDYLKLKHIQEFVIANADNFEDDDAVYMQDMIDDKLAKQWDHPDCSQLRNISYIGKPGTPEGYGRPMGIQTAQSLCAEAHDEDVPLIDLLYEYYPDAISFSIEISMPSAFDRELAREHLPSMEQRAGIRRVPVQEEGEIRTNINIADLVSKSNDDLRELIEAVNQDNEKRINELRNEINKLQRALERNEPRPTELSRVLDTSQYQFFVRNAYKLKYPVQYQQIARGQYKITISIPPEGHVSRAEEFIGEAEKHETQSQATVHVHPPGHKEVLDIMCRTYELRAGRACGLSKTGALSSLADRLLEYIHSRGMEDWQEVDWKSIDLFAKPGQIYSSEQAGEAFNTFVADFEGRHATKLYEPSIENENELSDEYSSDAIAGAIIDYDAVNVVLAKHLAEPSEALNEARDTALDILKRSGYYPLKLDDARKDADITYGQYGTSYDDQLAATIERMVH